MVFPAGTTTAINTILLFLEAQQRGFDDSRYMTFKQASEAGYKIRKGSKYPCLLLQEDRHRRTRSADRRHNVRKAIPYLTEYRVFNAQDIEGLEPAVVRPPEWKPVEVMEDW